MKKITIITILSIVLITIFAAPSFAMSPLAEKFVRSCYALDAPFPPQNWDKYDLQSAALEVLDAVENEEINTELLNFCLVALGSVGDPNDLPRIMVYKDDLEHTVLKSLRGFSHPDVVDYLLDKTASKEIVVRELSMLSLEKMDFNKFEKPMDWYNKVRDRLIQVRDKEKTDWLREDIQKVIDNLKVPEIEVS